MSMSKRANGTISTGVTGLGVPLQARTNADAVLAYVVKAASKETGHALALPRHGEGGPIIGKRAGWTQNIGAKARNCVV